jgi:hypothetical protein
MDHQLIFVYFFSISGALNELKELLGDAVTLVIETIEKHINCFFVQALQLDPKGFCRKSR